MVFGVLLAVGTFTLLKCCNLKQMKILKAYLSTLTVILWVHFLFSIGILNLYYDWHA